jgi:hypothetical protein
LAAGFYPSPFAFRYTASYRTGSINRAVLPLKKVENSTSPYEDLSGWMFVIGQPDRPPLPEARLYPSSSAGAFTNFLAT